MGGGPDAALDSHVSGQSNKPISAPAHAMKWTAVAEELQTDTDDGLTNEDAKGRLEEYGENVLGKVLISQNILVYFLHSIANISSVEL